MQQDHFSIPDGMTDDEGFMLIVTFIRLSVRHASLSERAVFITLSILVKHEGKNEAVDLVVILGYVCISL